MLRLRSIKPVDAFMAEQRQGAFVEITLHLRDSSSDADILAQGQQLLKEVVASIHAELQSMP